LFARKTTASALVTFFCRRWRTATFVDLFFQFKIN
jgi:hypothetical protein